MNSISLYKILNNIGFVFTISKQDLNLYYTILSGYENFIFNLVYKVFTAFYGYYSLSAKYYSMGSSYLLY